MKGFKIFKIQLFYRRSMQLRSGNVYMLFFIGKWFVRKYYFSGHNLKKIEECFTAENFKKIQYQELNKMMREKINYDIKNVYFTNLFTVSKRHFFLLGLERYFPELSSFSCLCIPTFLHHFLIEKKCGEWFHSRKTCSPLVS